MLGGLIQGLILVVMLHGQLGESCGESGFSCSAHVNTGNIIPILQHEEFRCSEHNTVFTYDGCREIKTYPLSLGLK